MALEFKKFARTDGNLTDLGTVKTNAGKKGSISFIRKNFNSPDKRVALVITNAKGDSAVVSCSQAVSTELRNKRMTIAQLAGLSILENEDGIPFISMPAEGGLQAFAVDSIKETAVEMKAEFLPEELVAF